MSQTLEDRKRGDGPVSPSVDGTHLSRTQAQEVNADHGAYTAFPAEATAHFEQFSQGQFVAESSFAGQDKPKDSQFYPPLPLPSQLLGDHAQFRGSFSNDMEDHHHQQVAQWSTQQLNPRIYNFKDPELDRESSGSSVLDDSAIIGESGRTYHGYKDGLTSYLLPNDGAEQDRLDFQHAMMAHLWDGRLVLAPLPRAPKLVLDVATGTGIWALEFARANPTSFIVGTDLSKIQPVPDVPNCLFERVDCEEEWLYSYNFDYIHIRMIIAAIRDPKRLLRQAFDNLSPGGWIEMQDADMDLRAEEGPDKDQRVATCYLKQYFDLLVLGASYHGIDLHKSQKYKEWLEEVGCKLSHETEYISFRHRL